jgi:HEPN domain-containing protein
MSFRNGQAYAQNSEFTDNQLAEITPNDLARWFCLKAYGVADPAPNANPTVGRSSSLEFYKKAISYYMPNRLSAWDVISNTGNPTRSIEINELLKRIKKKEVRKQGKQSLARRALEKREFEQTLELLNNYDDITRKYMVPTAMKFQYAMVARLDDTCQFKEEDLKPNPQFPFSLLCRMCWSKNVLEERDAPDQVLLGSMDPKYCILLALGIFLEVWTEAGEGLANDYLFGNTGNPQTSKGRISDILKSVWDLDAFERVVDGPVGTHSLRKFASTHARRSGCSKDDVDSRGRWRKRRVVDRYIDVNLPYPDAKVAAALCMGGPCKYVLKNGSGITTNWLLEHVVPNIRQSEHFQDPVATVLALPLLWACFNMDAQAFVPNDLRNRIRDAYAVIRQLEPAENPVAKILLVVTGEDAEVYIDEVFNPDEQPPPPPGDNNMDHPNPPNLPNNINNTRGLAHANFQALYSQNVALRREVQELRAELQSLAERETQRFGILNTSIRRIALQPVRFARNNGNANNEANNNEANNNNNNANNLIDDNNEMDNNATLSPNPRTLFVLWQEYEFGIAGRKAARLFTAQERGRAKYSYHRRKVVWDKISQLIRAGHTAQTAIDMIYQAYGVNTPTSRIINQMRADRLNGGHPNLQV